MTPEVLFPFFQDPGAPCGEAVPPEPVISSKDSIPLEPVLPDPIDRLKQRALIGKTLVVKGEVNGDQDLVVKGRIEGNISLPGRTITVRHEGRADQGDMISPLEGFTGRRTSRASATRKGRSTSRGRRRETIMDGVFHRMVCWRAQGAREPEYERSHTPLGRGVFTISSSRVGWRTEEPEPPPRPPPRTLPRSRRGRLSPNSFLISSMVVLLAGLDAWVIDPPLAAERGSESH